MNVSPFINNIHKRVHLVLLPTLYIFVTRTCTECSKSLKINSTLLDLIHDKWVVWIIVLFVFKSAQEK